VPPGKKWWEAKQNNTCDVTPFREVNLVEKKWTD